MKTYTFLGCSVISICTTYSWTINHNDDIYFNIYYWNVWYVIFKRKSNLYELTKINIH